MHLPPYSTYPQLQGGRIRLRALIDADLPVFAQICLHRSTPMTELADVQNLLQLQRQQYEQGYSLTFGIEDLATGQLAGIVGFYRGFDEQTGEVGYILLPEFRGRGLATLAVQLICRFAFDTMGLRCVNANTHAGNSASQAVLARCGFQQYKTQEEEQWWQLHPPVPYDDQAIAAGQE